MCWNCFCFFALSQLFSGHCCSFYWCISSPNYWSKPSNILSVAKHAQPRLVNLIMIWHRHKRHCKQQQHQRPHRRQLLLWLLRRKSPAVCAVWMHSVVWLLSQWYLQIPDAESTIGLNMPHGMVFIQPTLSFHHSYGLWAFASHFHSSHNSIKIFHGKISLAISSLYVDPPSRFRVWKHLTFGFFPLAFDQTIFRRPFDSHGSWSRHAWHSYNGSTATLWHRIFGGCNDTHTALPASVHRPWRGNTDMAKHVPRYYIAFNTLDHYACHYDCTFGDNFCAAS